MWSPATRSSNMNGPTQTGCAPNPSPSLVSWAGDMTVPSTVASVLASGVNLVFSVMTTVYGLGAVTVSTDAKSLARPDDVIMRLIVVTTASALNGVPSLNTIP